MTFFYGLLMGHIVESGWDTTRFIASARPAERQSEPSINPTRASIRAAPVRKRTNAIRVQSSNVPFGIRTKSTCAIRQDHKSLGRKPGDKDNGTLDLNRQGDLQQDHAGQDQVKDKVTESAQQVRGG
jgi:hypothetical protein